MDNVLILLKENIKAMRSKAGLTQSELAEKADISLRGLQSIEYGLSKSPEVNTVFKIAQALGVQVSDLLGENESDKPTKGELILSIVSALPSIEEDKLNFIVKIANSNADELKILSNSKDTQDSKTIASLVEKYGSDGLTALLQADDFRAAVIRQRAFEPYDLPKDDPKALREKIRYYAERLPKLSPAELKHNLQKKNQSGAKG
jgi:transcriptional regulator with XRE-family HTH domain